MSKSLSPPNTKLLLLGNIAYLKEMAKKYGKDCTIGNIIKLEEKVN